MKNPFKKKTHLDLAVSALAESKRRHHEAQEALHYAQATVGYHLTRIQFLEAVIAKHSPGFPTPEPIAGPLPPLDTPVGPIEPQLTRGGLFRNAGTLNTSFKGEETLTSAINEATSRKAPSNPNPKFRAGGLAEKK